MTLGCLMKVCDLLPTRVVMSHLSMQLHDLTPETCFQQVGLPQIFYMRYYHFSDLEKQDSLLNRAKSSEKKSRQTKKQHQPANLEQALGIDLFGTDVSYQCLHCVHDSKAKHLRNTWTPQKSSCVV